MKQQAAHAFEAVRENPEAAKQGVEDVIGGASRAAGRGAELIEGTVQGVEEVAESLEDLAEDAADAIEDAMEEIYARHYGGMDFKARSS